ncbi:MAG: polynucleotide adenylyltransferase PcnB [Chromatiales bacterium]|nr:polynucleotide adenylyltransferase PcnB [Gammaproteobacteria bacterium]MBW6475914.1 polynucleotide adenylyltransferase PcnB [Chromatiales bacterium]
MFSWLKNPWKRSRGGRKAADPSAPQIIPRGEHGISRKQISDYALKVLYRLNQAGHEAYLVGGGVRDLLLGREPKDFDVATSASPEEVRKLFRNCRLIGRRFRLAHVHYGREIIEVATFRAAHDVDGDGTTSDNGMLLRDNVYGSLEEDAWRRDFTVNALYYTVSDFSVIDHTGGLADLKAGQLRMIGDPQQRFHEDPVRMLRAVRFAAKLGFRIEKEVETAIRELGYLLEEVSNARLFDETLKLFLSGHGVASYELLRHYRLFGQLFPETDACLSEERDLFPHTLLLRALENTDRRIAEGKPVTPAFLYAALLWEPVRRESLLLMRRKMPALQAIQVAGDAVVARQLPRVQVPKRFSLQSREIWEWQERLARSTGKRAQRLMEQPRFRAAYDFLLLRAESGEELAELAEWWRALQESEPVVQAELLRQANRPGLPPEGGNGPVKKKRRRRPRKRPAAPASS